MSKYIKRVIEEEIINASNNFSAIIITGARQVGKSTLLNNLFKDKVNYITLDNLKARELAISDPELFLETFKAPLIIDEFQYAPNLLSHIKIIIDKMKLEAMENDSEASCMYYLTSSQMFHAMENISESLAGRVATLDLYSLSSREINYKVSEKFVPNINILQKKDKDIDYDVITLYERILRGGYPEIHKNKNISIERYFESYIRTYIERDIREIIEIKDELKFHRFISILAAHTGCELNISKICNEVEITNPTAHNWLSILSNTGLIYLLQPYHNNTVSRIIKRPKIYFMDTGLACYLSGYVDANILEKSAYNGQIFETYIVSEIIKSYTNKGLNPNRYISYYRDNNGNEIDLLITINNKIYPVEIKKSKNPQKKAIKHFYIAKKFNIEVGNGTVLCMVDDIFPLDKDNYLVPISYI